MATEDHEEERWLPCMLSREETEVKADQLARLLHTRDDRENARKQDDKFAKDEIKELDKTIDQIGEQVRMKSEDRTVRCRWQANDETRQMELVRLDTRAIVETRTMTDEDRQHGFGFRKRADVDG